MDGLIYFSPWDGDGNGTRVGLVESGVLERAVIGDGSNEEALECIDCAGAGKCVDYVLEKGFARGEGQQS